MRLSFDGIGVFSTNETTRSWVPTYFPLRQIDSISNVKVDVEPSECALNCSIISDPGVGNGVPDGDVSGDWVGVDVCDGVGVGVCVGGSIAHAARMRNGRANRTLKIGRILGTPLWQRIVVIPLQKPSNHVNRQGGA